MQTLILLFHPDLSRSRANAALAAAAAAEAGVEVVDMQALYPQARLDGDVEVARLLAADRIVLQFPVQWYATPALLKSWQDSVLTRMYYLRYEAEGQHLEGTPLMVAATAGNEPAAYAPDGVNLFSLEELLRPLQATAHRCRLPWARPFLLYRANRLEGPAFAEAARDYVARLRAWAADPAGAAVQNAVERLPVFAG